MQTYHGNPRDYQNIIEGNYEFHLSNYLRRGWEIFKSNSGGFVSYVLVYSLLSLGIMIIAPRMGFGNGFLTFIMMQVGSMVTVGLGAGFIVVAHKIAQGQGYEFGNFFDGLRDMVQLWLASLFVGWLTALPVSLGAYLAVGDELIQFFASIKEPSDLMYSLQSFEPHLIKVWLSSLSFSAGVYALSGAILSTIISLLYSFTRPNIIFGRLSFWNAMETSRKIVIKQIPSFLLLTLVLILSFLAAVFGISYLANAINSGVFSLLALFGIIVLSLVYTGYNYCVGYSVYEDVVFQHIDLSDEEDRPEE